MWINLDPAELDVIDAALYRAMASTAHDEAKAVRDKILKANAPAAEADAIFIAKARDLYADDECEIDDAPATSAGDGGTWVAAWVWVSNDDVEVCEECGAIPGTAEYGTVGDGFDGLCPSCADKAEEENENDD